MREFVGKTAFVTGGAAGIGLALGRAFAQSGMKVMLADIEADALQAAVKSLQEISPDISGTICDVADAASVERIEIQIPGLTPSHRLLRVTRQGATG